MPNLLISTRALGRDKPIIPDWSIPWPPDELDHGESLTLRALISRIVMSEVEAFRARQTQRRLVRVLSEREIERGLQRGKIESGGSDLDQRLDDAEAVGTALEAFEDGLYLVILDGTEQRDLDAQVFLKPDSSLVFLRLVMLAGA